MKELLIKIITVAYGGVGVLGLMAYWPTIKDLYRHKKKSANIASHVLWTATSLITFLYSLFILPDFLFRLVSGMNLSACSIVLFLSIRLNKHK